MLPPTLSVHTAARRSSHEERGLKYPLRIPDGTAEVVAPRMRSVD